MTNDEEFKLEKYTRPPRVPTESDQWFGRAVTEDRLYAVVMKEEIIARYQLMTTEYRELLRRLLFSHWDCKCCYCSSTFASHLDVSLDHFLPQSHEGGDEPENFVAACKACDNARGNRDALGFLRSLRGESNAESCFLEKRSSWIEMIRTHAALPFEEKVHLADRGERAGLLDGARNRFFAQCKSA